MDKNPADLYKGPNPSSLCDDRVIFANEIRELLDRKNWSISNLAFRWRVSCEYLSRLIANQARGPHWNDAFLGLPTLNLATRRDWTIERQRKRPNKARNRAPKQADLSGFRYRDDLVLYSEVIAVDVGDGFTNGSRGVVIEVVQSDNQECYVVEIEGRKILCSPDDIDVLFVSTGRVVNV